MISRTCRLCTGIRWRASRGWLTQNGQVCTPRLAVAHGPPAAQIGGYARIGPDRALVTERHPALGPISRPHQLARNRAAGQRTADVGDVRHADQAGVAGYWRVAKWPRLMSMAIPRIDSPCFGGTSAQLTGARGCGHFTADGGGPPEPAASEMADTERYVSLGSPYRLVAARSGRQQCRRETVGQPSAEVGGTPAALSD